MRIKFVAFYVEFALLIMVVESCLTVCKKEKPTFLLIKDEAPRQTPANTTHNPNGTLGLNVTHDTTPNATSTLNQTTHNPNGALGLNVTQDTTPNATATLYQSATPSPPTTPPKTTPTPKTTTTKKSRGCAQCTSVINTFARDPPDQNKCPIDVVRASESACTEEKTKETYEFLTYLGLHPKLITPFNPKNLKFKCVSGVYNNWFQRYVIYGCVYENYVCPVYPSFMQDMMTAYSPCALCEGFGCNAKPLKMEQVYEDLNMIFPDFTEDDPD